jgi:hypothetical protein
MTGEEEVTTTVAAGADMMTDEEVAGVDMMTDEEVVGVEMMTGEEVVAESEMTFVDNVEEQGIDPRLDTGVVEVAAAPREETVVAAALVHVRLPAGVMVGLAGVLFVMMTIETVTDGEVLLLAIMTTIVGAHQFTARRDAAQTGKFIAEEGTIAAIALEESAPKRE